MLQFAWSYNQHSIKVKQHHQQRFSSRSYYSIIVKRDIYLKALNFNGESFWRSFCSPDGSLKNSSSFHRIKPTLSLSTFEHLIRNWRKFCDHFVSWPRSQTTDDDSAALNFSLHDHREAEFNNSREIVAKNNVFNPIWFIIELNVSFIASRAKKKTIQVAKSLWKKYQAAIVIAIKSFIY